MSKTLSALQPQPVWDIFEEICQHPHPSKQEEKLAKYIMGWAKENNLTVKTDTLGNIIIKKPATVGMENRKPVVLQGHIDMVCEKNSDVEFDFENDPIQTVVDGDWVRAKGTTLGADNGIGVAMAMAVMQSKDIPHPPLEALFTLDEETGLTGAIQLDKGMLDAEILINLDSEEDGAFTIGCAGGMNTSGSFKYHSEPVPSGTVAYQLALKGLKGGHSGIEIHDGRGNAIKFLNRTLWNLNNELDIRVSSINSGNKHNAIPREGFATVVIPQKDEKSFLDFIGTHDKIFKEEYQSKEPNISLSAIKTELPGKVLKKEVQNSIFNTFYAMPHGVLRMSPDIPGLVQSSTNFAIVETHPEEVFVLTSQRSSIESEKDDVAAMVKAAFDLGGANVKQGDGYPGWQPNVNSPILKTAIEVFKSMYGHEPKIEAIHAGLECGLVGEKYPGMDMLSFGPNLKDVHSPDECVQISTVGKCWNLLKEILKNIPEKKLS
jgi:dipeptidase D